MAVVDFGAIPLWTLARFRCGLWRPFFMVFNVKITESYTYSRQVGCADESELSEILHEEHPLLVDLPK